MIKGIITYIDYNRKKTATKIRIGSRVWVFMRYLNIEDLNSLIGARGVFHGEWKNSPSFGRYYVADSYHIIGYPDKEKTRKRIFKYVQKIDPSLANQYIELFDSLLISLHAMGKKALIMKFLKWPREKQFGYVQNPFLFFLNGHCDFYSAEVIASHGLNMVSKADRIAATMVKILEDAYQNGNESLNLTKFKDALSEDLKEDIGYQYFLEMAENNSKLKVEMDNAYLGWIFYLRQKAISRLNVNDKYCLEIESNDSMLKELLQCKWSILSGGAGTGKTTLLRRLKEIEGLNVVYCATTGKAAKVLSDDASTVHHILGYTKGKFTVERLEDCDLMIVDESSMLDWYTLYAIVKAVPRGIFAGDPEQLPPVQGESVFKKMMEILPVVKLDKNWRFENAHNGPDVEEIRRGDSYAILTTLQSIIASFKRQGKSYQVLSPVKGGMLGIDNINRIMQRSNHAPLIGAKKYFKIYDRVIVKRNVYIDGTLVASNGEIGVVSYGQKNYIAVDFTRGKLVLLEEEDMELAYALTVHRAQGSEYDNVVFVIPPDMDNEFLSDELLNVGKTRGKIKTYVLVQKHCKPAMANTI